MLAFDDDRPLAGVRVLDCGMNIAGPEAASLLADLGADVIKVEAPRGDTSRALQPMSDGVSEMVAAVNRNKRYLGLDLGQPAASRVLTPLLEWADVLVQNLRPGKATSLGIDAGRCHAVNPRLVHVSIEAFYPAEAIRPGYDLLVQAETGMMHLTGEPDRAPSRLPGSLLDHISGLWSAFGITAALHGKRERAELVISMSDIAQSLLGDRVAAYLMSGEVPQRMGSAIGVTTPLQAYPTADGDVVVGAASDALYRRLCAVIDPSLADDPRFRGQADRLAHRQELNELIESALSTASADVWLLGARRFRQPSPRTPHVPPRARTRPWCSRRPVAAPS